VVRFLYIEKKSTKQDVSASLRDIACEAHPNLKRRFRINCILLMPKRLTRQVGLSTQYK